MEGVQTWRACTCRHGGRAFVALVSFEAMMRPAVAMCVLLRVLLSTMVVRLPMPVIWYP